MAAERGRSVLFVATAEATDEEMAERIAAHRASRSVHWRTLEVKQRVGPAIRDAVGEADVVLVDCITLLAGTVITGLPEPITTAAAERALDGEVDDLLAAYAAGQAMWIVVSNEVGLGLVPPNPLGRAYRDALGRANQRLAAVADEVVWMVAGLPSKVKG